MVFMHLLINLRHFLRVLRKKLKFLYRLNTFVDNFGVEIFPNDWTMTLFAGQSVLLEDFFSETKMDYLLV